MNSRGIFPGMCGHKPDCADYFCPGREIGRERESAVLALEIADEACRVDIECCALHVPSDYPHPVYDLNHLDGFIDDPEICAANRAAIARAVRYLDLRSKLVRPIKGQPQFVSFHHG